MPMTKDDRPAGEMLKFVQRIQMHQRILDQHPGLSVITMREDLDWVGGWDAPVMPEPAAVIPLRRRD